MILHQHGQRYQPFCLTLEGNGSSESIHGAIQYNTVSCNTIQFHAIQYSFMQYNTISCNTIQFHAIQCNTVSCNTVSCNTMQFHAIQYRLMHYKTVSCNTIQFHAIQYSDRYIAQVYTLLPNTGHENKIAQPIAPRCQFDGSFSPVNYCLSVVL